MCNVHARCENQLIGAALRALVLQHGVTLITAASAIVWS
jgi:hypothetical protein